MSLFRDDFYSTKPSKQSIREAKSGQAGRVSGSRMMRRTPDRMMMLALILLAVGLLLTVVILVSSGGSTARPVSSEVHGIGEPENDVVVGEGNGSGDGDSSNSSHHGRNGGDQDGSTGTGDATGKDSSGSSPGSPADKNGQLEDDSEKVYRSAISKATDKVYDAVVSIVTPADEGGGADWLDVYAIGSGIIFRVNDDQAYIVTNHHVASAAEELEIVLVDGQKKKAKLIGSDAISDLAILMTDAEGINQAAEFGSSYDLQRGEPAIAIGSPLGLGHTHTITSGIISSTQRSIPVSLSGNGALDWEMEVIQTDAAINSGNSGGALINIEGEVIGINTMKISWIGVEGIGFAIPIDLAGPIIEELIEYGRVSRPYIGIGAINLSDYFGEEPLDLPDDVKAGAVILSVEGPAKKAGLRDYDVIVQLDDREVRSMIDVRKYLYTEKQIGDEIEVTVYRNGKDRIYTLELGELP